MTTIAFKHLVAAAAHFHRLVRAQLVVDDGVAHAQTQILGAARLAGLLMFRGLRVDCVGLAPGMRVPSEEGRVQGERLLETLLLTLRQLGHPTPRHSLDPHCASAALARLAFAEIHERLTPAALVYLAQSPMGMTDAAMAAAVATAGLIHDHAPAMPPHQAAALAALGFEEGLSTVPWPLSAAHAEALCAQGSSRGSGAAWEPAYIRTMS